MSFSIGTGNSPSRGAQHDLRELVNKYLRGRNMTTPDANGWMPIETAPKDGPAFIVWCPERFNIYCVINYRGVMEHFGPGADPLRETPTHWQPLPKPPASS